MKRFTFLAFIVVLALTAQSSAQQSSAPKPAASGKSVTVGILLLSGTYITELAGPLDVYHHVPRELVNVVLIGDKPTEQQTYEGMLFRPTKTIDQVSSLDVLVIPSGSGSLTNDPKNARVVGWIKEIARTAKYVTSHCEGAFLLGAAGLLDGREATTFHADQPELQKRYPTCRVRTDQRIVVDGNLITSAGGLASYEGSLYVVERLFGREQAETIATALVFGPSNLEALRSVRAKAQR